MSFFDNSKNFGLALIFVGLITVVFAIVNIIMNFTDGDFSSDEQIGWAIVGVGSIIYGLLVAGLGQKIRGSEISKKIQILSSYVRIVGVGTIIIGIFAAAGSLVINGDFGATVLSAIISIILGLIVIWASTKIGDGKVDTIDKILWIILTVVFAILAIFSLIAVFDFSGDIIIVISNIVVSIAEFVIYVFLLLLLFDPEVKKAMGM